MKTYVVCFQCTGGIAVEAESEEQALEYFWSDACQQEVLMNLDENFLDVTEVFEEG